MIPPAIRDYPVLVSAWRTDKCPVDNLSVAGGCWRLAYYRQPNGSVAGFVECRQLTPTDSQMSGCSLSEMERKIKVHRVLLTESR